MKLYGSIQCTHSDSVVDALLSEEMIRVEPAAHGLVHDARVGHAAVGEVSALGGLTQVVSVGRQSALHDPLRDLDVCGVQQVGAAASAAASLAVATAVAAPTAAAAQTAVRI